MCDPILVTLLKMRPHYSHSSHENATPSSGASPLASYKEVPLPRVVSHSQLRRSLSLAPSALTQWTYGKSSLTLIDSVNYRSYRF